MAQSERRTLEDPLEPGTMDARNTRGEIKKTELGQTLREDSPFNGGQHGPNHSGSNVSRKAQLQIASGENQGWKLNFKADEHGTQDWHWLQGARTDNPKRNGIKCNGRPYSEGDQHKKIATRKTEYERKDGQGSVEAKRSMQKGATQAKSKIRPPVQCTVPPN